MLDHVFTDAIGALRDAMEAALLERVDDEERFLNDVISGELSWEVAYSLPGEADPRTARADVRLGWDTWSQTAYREWIENGELGGAPKVTIEIALRIEELPVAPDPAVVAAGLPSMGPAVRDERLLRSGPTIETVHGGDDPGEGTHALEVGYAGEYELDEPTLSDGAILDEAFASIGVWIASTLVVLGDLAAELRPA